MSKGPEAPHGAPRPPDAPSGDAGGAFAASQPAGGPWAPAGPWAPQEAGPGGPYVPEPQPGADRPRQRGSLGRWFAGWSLRGRLLAAILAMMALVSLVIGVVSVVAMRSYLIGQLDEKLAAAGDRAASAMSLRPGGRGGVLDYGQGDDTLSARVRDGEILGDVFVVDARRRSAFAPSRVAVNAAPLIELPHDGRGYTRDLGPDLGRYRLMATRTLDGSYAVTGLPTKGVTDTAVRLSAIITLVALAGLAAAGFVGAAIVRMTLRPLNRVAATARQVSTLPLDRGEVALAVRVPEEDTDPRTEVGQVGAALNAMLGHVDAALTARQASETRIRRFVADASHELRTPLAAIRGYAELSRRSQEPVPPDVAHAMARVESQAVRMTGLVEDLLLLASLDSGRPLQLAPVDLSMLLVNAVSDAHAAGPDQRWLLDLPDEPVTVVGEAARLTQVVVNLLANARAHTPAGTTVRAALGVDGPYAVVTVSDDGPGIPPSLLPEVFERFARGDTSRSRAAGSTGLGLSIVAAVAAAHHGTVAVESVPGRTVFTVRLPLAGPVAA